MDDNPIKLVKVGFDLPVEGNNGLIECLRANFDLFAVSTHEIPSIHPSLACMLLNIKPSTQYIPLRRIRESLKKVEVTTKIIHGLLYANFISKIKHNEWIFNLVLVIQKWRMCIDYTDLKKACPKDSYLLIRIDRLI